MFDLNMKSFTNKNGTFTVGDKVKLKDRDDEVVKLLSFKLDIDNTNIVIETDKGTLPLEQLSH